MPNTVIQLKKSATVSAKPSDLANGELAINFADGKLFYKNTAGFIAEISGGAGTNSFGTVNANGTLVVSDTSGDILTLLAGNNITITGDAVNDRVTIGLTDEVVVPGVLYMRAIGGDEGGQIELANAITNSTLAGNVIIDVYQNKLRFYEKDSPNKGAFIDLSIASTGVGSNLLFSNDTTARATSEAAFNKANSAFITLDGANTAIGAGANAFASATIAGANVAVGTGANTYILSVIAGANAAVGTGANAFTSATISGANTAVGTGANTYLLTTLTGANTAVGTAANNFATATIAGANTAVGIGANTFATAAAAGANAYMISVQDGSNTAVGTGANTYLLATIAGANVAVGTGANTYLLTTLAGANTAVGTGANAFASATVAGANTAVGAGANNYANSTFVKLTAGNQTITGDLAIVGNLTLSGNTVFIDATRLQIDDPLIYLAGNNYSSDIVDIGFIGNYVNSTGQNVHTGLFRDHTTKEYYLFHSYDQEPINNHIDPTGNNLTLAVLNSAVRTSNLVLGGANLLTTLAGSNAAVGTGANTVGSAAFAKANAALANATGTFAGTLTISNNLITTGNVGIGTSNPTARLNIVTNTGNDAVRITQTGAGNALVVEDSANPDVSPFIVTNIGYVGVGTNDPQELLHVSGGTLINGPLNINDSSISRIQIFSSGSYVGGIGTSDAFEADMSTDIGILADTGKSIRFYTDSALYERMRITSTGNIGIGRTDPGYKLDVVGTINASNVLINGNPIGAGGGASVAISDSAPTSPSANSLWWSSDLGKLFIYYNDGSSNQWVETSPSPDTTEIFNTANSARDIAILSFNRANTTASGFDTANSAQTTAIAAFARANSAQTTAIAAFARANTAVSTGKAIAMAIVFG